MPSEVRIEEAAGGPATDMSRILRVLIAYENVHSGHRAVRLLHNLQQGVGQDFQFQPIPWSFALLSDPAWSEIALGDAAGADMIWVSAETTAPLPSAVEQWVKAAVNEKQGTTAAVVAILGPLGSRESCNVGGLQSVRQAAQSAALDFFLPQNDQSLLSAFESIRQRADTITPLLAGMLDHHSDAILLNNAQA